MGSGDVDYLERNQEFGAQAKHPTSILVFPKALNGEPVTVDRYGRTVAFVRLRDILVNAEPIRQGLVRIFTRYCDWAICEQRRGLEDEARAARRGLWSMPNAIPPWEFRRSQRQRQSLYLPSPTFP